MKNREYESMTRVVCQGYVVRVWFKEPHSVFGPNLAVQKALEGVTGGSAWDIADALDRLEESGHAVAAYEILDSEGNGMVIYPDWK